MIFFLSGYEDDVTSGNASWARIKADALLALHMVDAIELLQIIARHRRGNQTLLLRYIMWTDVQPAVRLDKGVSASTTGTQVLDVGMKTLS